MDLNSRRSYLKANYEKYQEERNRISISLYQLVRTPNQTFTVLSFMESLQLFLGEDPLVKDLYRHYASEQLRIYVKNNCLLCSRSGKQNEYKTREETHLPPYEDKPLSLPFHVGIISKRAKRKKNR